MSANRNFTEVLPVLIPLESRSVTLEDLAVFDSRIIDITDVISDPENPLPDFGQALNITSTRAWVLGWAVRIDLIAMGGFVGTNRTMLTLEILDFVRRQALTETSQDLVRLHIPDNSVGRYVYTGDRIINSKHARVSILNQTGDQVILDVDIWAKAW